MPPRRLSGKERGIGNGIDRMVPSPLNTDNSHTRHLITGITQESSLLTSRASADSETNKFSTDILNEVTIGKKHNKIVMSVRTQFRENSSMINS